MEIENRQMIQQAKKAALEVLLHNVQGPFDGLPRTAGWGYPEPYTRDLLLSILGVAVTGNKILIDSMRLILETLAKNQTKNGHISSLVHSKNDLGASDTTPLFLFAVGVYRKLTNEPDFLEKAVEKAMVWMEYQSPSDGYLIAQQPTSDWRDELWIYGYGLYVNTLSYSYLSILGYTDRAMGVRNEIDHMTLKEKSIDHFNLHEGLKINNKPYYACWSYKNFSSNRFDLLGNSLAILSGISTAEDAEKIIQWVEDQLIDLREDNQLKGDLPPNFFPYILPGDDDWLQRYERYNTPGNYHNGGVWPFICAFYVAALVANQKYDLAEEKLLALIRLNRDAKNKQLKFGFNEWIGALDGKPMGQDWQSWSAALFLYAVACVEQKRTPFFDEIRTAGQEQDYW